MPFRSEEYGSKFFDYDRKSPPSWFHTVSEWPDQLIHPDEYAARLPLPESRSGTLIRSFSLADPSSSRSRRPRLSVVVRSFLPPAPLHMILTVLRTAEYGAGMTLRFPRCIRIRWDKELDEGMDLESAF